MSKSNENNPHTVVLDVGTHSAGAAATVVGFEVTKPCRVKSAHLINNAALSLNGTNFVTVAARKKGGNDVASASNEAAAFVAREGLAMTLGAEADTLLAAGDSIELDVSHDGTGGALTLAKVQLVMHYL